MLFARIFSLIFLVFTFLNVDSCFSKEFILSEEYDQIEATADKSKKRKLRHEENEDNIGLRTPDKVHNLQKAVISGKLGSLSPSSKQCYFAVIRRLGGSIINPDILSVISHGEVMYTPFARVFMSRRKVNTYKAQGLMYSLPPIAFTDYVQLPPETEKEKRERKEREYAYFQSLNNLDKVVFTNLIEKEASYWVHYWNYIKIEKKKILNNERKKLRPEELEDIAKSVSLTHYESFKVEDTIFYYNLDSLVFSLQDSLGRTNIQRLKDGLNPVGGDGYSMEIHHLTMFDDSLLVLLSRTLHEGVSLKSAAGDDEATFHLQPSYYGRTTKSDINRAHFAKITKKIYDKLIKISTASSSTGFLSSEPSAVVPVDDAEFDKFLMGGDSESIGEGVDESVELHFPSMGSLSSESSEVSVFSLVDDDEFDKFLMSGGLDSVKEGVDEAEEISSPLPIKKDVFLPHISPSEAGKLSQAGGSSRIKKKGTKRKTVAKQLFPLE